MITLDRYFVILSYNGTGYNGWQTQPHEGTKTIQGTLDAAFALVLQTPISTTGCGRTDTGVHAIDYVAHVDLPKGVDIGKLKYKANIMLPDAISIQSITKVMPDAHARFDATERSYKYYIHQSKNPFLVNSYYYNFGDLSLEKLNEVAILLKSYKAFAPFCKLHSDNMTMNCIIKESYWYAEGEQLIYKVTADRFLRGMIRMIIGMSINVCRKKISLDELNNALDTQTRLTHNWSVPANGLILCDIKYPYIIK